MCIALDYLLMFSCLGVGMVLNEEKMSRLAEVIACLQAALKGVGGSALSAPIVVVPLAAAHSRLPCKG